MSFSRTGPNFTQKKYLEKNADFFFKLIRMIFPPKVAKFFWPLSNYLKHMIKNIFFNAIVVWQMGFYFSLPYCDEIFVLCVTKYAAKTYSSCMMIQLFSC